MEFVKRLFKMNPKCGETEANKARSKAYATYRVLQRILADVAQSNSEIMTEHNMDFIENYSLNPNLSPHNPYLQEKKAKSHFQAQKCPIF
jgi:hypothetical protein